MPGTTVDREFSDSLPQIIRTIPKECFQPQLGKSLLYVARDLGIVVATAALIVWVDSWILGPVIAILMGCGLGGLFVIGHDAGHRSFCKSTRLNNAIGHITTSPVFWPFHIWRLDHDKHHRHSSHIDKDTAWRPTTYKLWKRMPKNQKYIYKKIRSGFFFMGSLYTTYQLIKDGLKADSSPLYSDIEKQQVKFSLRLTFLTVLIYVVLSFYLAGFYGFICLFIIPNLVFHFLLSTLTYFHHTAPDVKFLGRHEWDAAKAQLQGTLHVGYPRVLESLIHDINWHVPHHVCVGIPHYHLRKAHMALKSSYPDDVREYTLNLEHIKAVTSKCHFITSRNRANPDLSWMSFDEALALEKTPKKETSTPLNTTVLQGSEI